MNFPKPTKEKYLWILASLFLLFALSNILLDIYEDVSGEFLWFCINITLIFSIGLFYKNKLLISSTLTSAFLIEILWAIDVSSFLITGSPLIGVFDYFSEISNLRMIQTFYHLFLLIVPLYVIIRIKEFHKFSWAFSSFHFLLVSILTLFLTNSNVNCVRSACSPGALNQIYALKPAFLPLLMFNWITLSLFVFIPTHIFFYYLIKRLKTV